MKKQSVKDNLAKLIDLKSIITIVLVFVACFVFIKSGGVITSEQFVPILVMVMTFYFVKKGDKS